jgi:hypothetical protein
LIFRWGFHSPFGPQLLRHEGKSNKCFGICERKSQHHAVPIAARWLHTIAPLRDTWPRVLLLDCHRCRRNFTGGTMANVRVTSTGKIFYDVPPLMVGLLVEALPSVYEIVRAPENYVEALAQRHAAPAPTKTSPRIFLEQSTLSGNMGIHCIWPNGAQHSIFEVKATKADAEKAFGVAIPDNLWQQFEAARAPKDPVVEAEKWNQIKNQDEIRRHKEAALSHGR